MKQKTITASVTHMRTYFQSGATQTLHSRLSALEKLRDMLDTYRDEIVEALSKDLHKPEFETLTTEIYPIKSEITYAIKHISCWMQSKTVHLSYRLFPMKAYKEYAPLGVTLIIAPWNYPLQLSLLPLVGAIAAGNCSILKPSEYAKATAHLIKRMIHSTFDNSFVDVTLANAPETQHLLEQQKFDHIFFTGGPKTGSIIMQTAAKTLTPVTLELGGKNACIVTKDANIEKAAHIIAWAKFLNAGQTCIAPDYILVEQDCKEPLVEALKAVIKSLFGSHPEKSKDYGRIINQEHTERLISLLQTSTILSGGAHDLASCFIEPTLIDTENNLKTPLMEQEIFGPLLPLVTFTTFTDALAVVRSLPAPLTIGLFSNSKNDLELLKSSTQSGSITHNELMVYAGSERIPFGGIQQSGMGRYHGRASFTTFSYERTITYGSSWLYNRIRSAPYKLWITKLFKLFLRYRV